MKFNRSDFADLAYFLAVAKYLNFRRAGVELGISTSAVSHALKGLEERIGVRLLNRTSRSVTLTSAGEKLRDTLEHPFEEISHAVEVLNHYRDAPTGHIRLNVMTGAAAILLRPVLPAFIKKYPDIILDLSVTNQMIDIIGHGFDAGIRFGGTVPQDMIAQRLSPDLQWVVAGSPEYFKKNGRPIHPRDLAFHRCMQIRLGDDSLYRWEFEKEGEELAIAVPGPVILDEGVTAINLALEGMGLVYLNEWDIKSHVEQGLLETVLDDWSVRGQGYHIYYSSRRQVPTGIRLLIELVKEMKPLG